MKAILILGAAVWSDGPSPTLRRRTRHAAQVWRNQPDCLIVPCGGVGTHSPSEAQVMRDILMAEGVPPDRIQIEDRSTTTLENIRFARAILDDHGISEVIIVTDRTHAPRARLVARHFRLSASVSSPPLREGRKMTHLRQMIRETLALPIYLIRLLRTPRD